MPAELDLPLYKRGDDLAYQLGRGLSNSVALEADAANLDAAAQQLRQVAAAIKRRRNVGFQAMNHCIQIDGPAAALQPLIDQGLLAKLDFPDDDGEPEDDEELAEDDSEPDEGS